MWDHENKPVEEEIFEDSIEEKKEEKKEEEEKTYVITRNMQIIIKLGEINKNYPPNCESKDCIICELGRSFKK
jgi:hypothetical protein